MFGNRKKRAPKEKCEVCNEAAMRGFARCRRHIGVVVDTARGPIEQRGDA